MTEYIEREKALDSVREKVLICESLPDTIAKDASLFTLASMNDSLNSIPAADVRPVVRAVWRRYSPFTDTYECSNCGEQVIDQQFRTNFCPNCGADMREK